MKKLLSLAFVFVIAIFLVACGNNKKDFETVFNENLIVYATGEDATKVTKDLTFFLSSTQVEGAKIFWESNKPNVITVIGSKGQVTQPTDDDTEVELTATVTIGKQSDSKVFKVTVLKFSVKKYTVTFVYGPHQQSTTTQVVENGLAVKPNNPTRDGYNFLGWFKDEEAKTPFNFQTDKITADISIYAGWAEVGQAVLTKLYQFNFSNTELGNSYSSNNDVTKKLVNVLGGQIDVTLQRVAVNNNHGTYKDDFLVFSASNTSSDNDVAYIIFNFNQKVTKMEFDIVFWSGFDLEQTRSIDLQRKVGDNWVDIADIKELADGTLEYKKLTIENLDDQVLRIYAMGTDPTGAGANGARFMIDNMEVYGYHVPGEDTVAPVISGATNKTLTVGDTAPDWLAGVTAVDDVDGTVTVTVVENNVNLQAAGTYIIKYQAKDAAGNTAEVSITVVVNAQQSGGLVESYSFNFSGTDFGNSYSSNTDAAKSLPNLKGGTVSVTLTRAAQNNNHGTYKDDFLVLSASVKDNDNDYAYIVFNFDKKVNKLEFEIAFWSDFDATQTTKLVLQRKNGENWVDVANIKDLASDTTTYKKITIDNLDDQVLRIYAEGTDPTGSGNNGARALFDNMKAYSAGAPGEDTVAPVISGASDKTFTVGDTAPNWLEGVTAVDNVDGTVAVTIIENTVNLQTAGTYKIKYQAKDSKGNTAEVSITVTVVAESTGGDLVEAYKFNFNSTGYGNSYPNIDTPKTLANLLGGTVNITLNRTGVQTKSGFPDEHLVMSASDKRVDNDFAYVIFNFDKKVSKMELDIAYWSDYDVAEVTKLVLQRKVGENWVDIIDLKPLVNGATAYKKITIDNLDDQILRIYAEGSEPTGSGNNGARVIIDNMSVYTGSALPTAQSNLNKDLADLNIISTYMEAGKIDLPSLASRGSTITWAYANSGNTNNSLVNLTTKDVTMPASGQVSVVITATLTNGEYTGTKQFTLLIGEGEPTPINQVRALASGSKVKVKGAITAVYETATEVRFFIQDDNGGIYVVAPIAQKAKLVIGNEVSLIAVRDSLGLSNVTKVDVTGTKTVTAVNLTNPSDFTQNLGKLVKITGLLTKTYGAADTTYSLVNAQGNFTLVIPTDLGTKSTIQAVLANLETGIAVTITANVNQANELVIVNKDNLVVESAINTTSIKQVILSKVVLPNTTDKVISNLTLITTATVFNGTTFTWTSNNTSVISNTGVVTRPNDDTIVRLSYQIKINTTVIGDGYLDVTVAKKNSYTGYYESLNGVSESQLKAALTTLITSTMKNLTYDDARYILDDSDADPAKPGNVILVYNRASVSGAWDGGTTWNREHVWPQSKLGSASDADLQNLKPANQSINSSRGNDPFAAGSGTYGRVTGGWYPGDKDKGDIARIVFYMNTRWGLAINSNIGTLSLFIQWHNEDPVDDFERNRNEVIFQKQKNRNPYIDHPELVDVIYGKMTVSSYLENSSNLQVVELTIEFNRNYNVNLNDIERKEYLGF